MAVTAELMSKYAYSHDAKGKAYFVLGRATTSSGGRSDRHIDPTWS
jgi:hypothetical protein